MTASPADRHTSNPLLCISTFEARVSEAKAMLRGGYSEREVREKHGGCVLAEALKQLPLRALAQSRRKQ